MNFNQLPKEMINSVLSVVISVAIIIAGVSFIAGREYAKHEVRTSYCSVFKGDPRCNG